MENNPHVLVLPFPAQGHMNPMHGFCKRLTSYGPKTTFATTVSFSKSFNFTPSPSIQYDTISDGFDDGGVVLDQDNSVQEYLARFESVASKALADLITRHSESSSPIDCIVYDSYLPWALNVAKQFGLAGAAFLAEACTVDHVYYCVHHQVLKLPISSFPIAIDGLRLLSRVEDLPSFIGVEGSYPVYFEAALSQFSNVHEADFVLVNSVYEWEKEVVDSMSKVLPLLTIGPTIPSVYLDDRVRDDKEYGFDLFISDSSIVIANWLNNKPQTSVVYVSFGSMACLNNKQMEELALGLKASKYFFLWVVRATEQSKLPKNFAEETNEKGLIVKWCPQMEVLSHPSVGCFLTHCGWNSTIEALSLGVPMVGMPQWTDQPTDAKLVQDLWKVGVRVKVGEDGIVGKNEIEYCIRQVMKSDLSEEMRKNAKKWSDVALQAISEGGSSDSSIRKFISSLIN